MIDRHSAERLPERATRRVIVAANLSDRLRALHDGGNR